MRTACLAVLVLLVLDASCLSIFSKTPTVLCCTSRVKTLNSQKIISYTKTSETCSQKAYLVQTKRGVIVCADPKAPKVKVAIQEFENAKRHEERKELQNITVSAATLQ